MIDEDSEFDVDPDELEEEQTFRPYTIDQIKNFIPKIYGRWLDRSPGEKACIVRDVTRSWFHNGSTNRAGFEGAEKWAKEILSDAGVEDATDDRSRRLRRHKEDERLDARPRPEVNAVSEEGN